MSLNGLMNTAGIALKPLPVDSLRPIAAPWSLDPPDVVEALASDADAGLSEVSVRRRAEHFGANEITTSVEPPVWKRVLTQFRDPLVMLLLVAIVVLVIAWLVDGATKTPIDAIVIAVIVLLNAALGFWQEREALNAVAALRAMTAVHTTVRRGGRMTSVPNSDLVPGDIILLEEGNAIGADARLLDVVNLRVSEAGLTGESTAVGKSTAVLEADTDLGDRTNMVFGGTAVTSGRGTAVVVTTGMDTEIGRVASLIEQVSQEPTPLEREIQWLGRMLGLVVVVLAAIVVTAIAATSNLSGLAELTDALLVGVSLAVAAVPEGLSAIMSVILALGVQRMAKRNAVVKQLSSVETLGAASIICTDKTGTLTRNEMTIVRIETASGAVDVSGSGYEPRGRIVVNGQPVEDEKLRTEVEFVIEAGSLANNASYAHNADGHWEVLGDPTEAAFLVAEEKLGLVGHRFGSFDRVDEVPFTSERKMMSTLDRDQNFGSDRPAGEGDSPTELMMFTKGSPDVLLERCDYERVGGQVVELTDDRRQVIYDTIDRLAGQALRTLGVAYRSVESGTASIDVEDEQGLVHLGVVGIVDPPRDEVADAIKEARRAGIRIIMITGDHPRTAERIGFQLGIGDETSDAVTGRELSEMATDEFQKAVESTDVFARVSPEHKLRIVEELQRSGQVVAMTGDGVNDAPALKQADIGIAMGINGTEVSKDASDMILADDNFATIVRAVREGREIFDNIRKCVRYLLASNTGEVLVVFVGVLAAGWLGIGGAGDGLDVPLLATQILWINLLTDSALALALGLDPAVEDVMARPVRRIDEHIVNRSMVATIALIGVVSAGAGLLALDIELPGGLIEGSGTISTGRTMVFTTIVLAQIFNAFNSRSDTMSAFVRPFENRRLWAAVALTVALQAFVVHMPFMNEAFNTEPLDARRWLICAGLATSVLVADEVRKVVHRRT